MCHDFLSGTAMHITACPPQPAGSIRIRYCDCALVSPKQKIILGMEMLDLGMILLGVIILPEKCQVFFQGEGCNAIEARESTLGECVSSAVLGGLAASIGRLGSDGDLIFCPDDEVHVLHFKCTRCTCGKSRSLSSECMWRLIRTLCLF